MHGIGKISFLKVYFKFAIISKRYYCELIKFAVIKAYGHKAEEQFIEMPRIFFLFGGMLGMFLIFNRIVKQFAKIIRLK